MPLQFNIATVEVDGVQSVVVSPIQPTTDGLAYTRLIQIYIDPPSNINRRPVLEVSLIGGDQTIGDKSGLQVPVPPDVF